MVSSYRIKVNGPLFFKYVQGPMVLNQIRGNHNITRICMVFENFLPPPSHLPLFLTSFLKQQEACEINNKYPFLFDVTFVANVCINMKSSHMSFNCA